MSITLHASDYTAAKASSLRWTVRTSGRSPGLKLSKSSGETVKLSASKLSQPAKSGGDFSVTVTLKDTDKTTDEITFSGTLYEAPVIRTTKLAKLKAGGGTDYMQKMELKAGSEPLVWTLSGDLPEGVEFTERTSGGKTYHVLTGDTQDIGKFPLTLTVTNTELNTSDTKSYILETVAVKPAIKTPKGFARKYTVKVSDDVAIDLSALTFTGTKPISVDIDEASKKAWLTYDAETGTITGRIPETPKSGKLNVKLQVNNPYTRNTKPVTLTLNVSVKSPPTSIYSSVPYYASYGKSYKATFKSYGSNAPVKWDFLLQDARGGYSRSIVKENGGKLYGLKFSDKGTITGKIDLTAVNEGLYIRFKAVAYNDFGQTQSDPFTIVFGGAPYLLNFASTKITLTNGTMERIYLSDYIDYLTYNGDYPVDTPDGTIYIPGTSFSVSGKLPPGLFLYSYYSSEMGEYFPVLQGTPDIGSAKKAKKYTVNVTAQNQFGKAKCKLTITVEPAPAVDTDTGTYRALQETDDDTALMSGETLPFSPETQDTYGITGGEITGESGITRIAGDEYMVAALLPPVSADESGMYDIDAVISDDVAVGLELVYFAFPEDGEKSEDDEIAEFYDDEGAEIETVPENRRVTVSAWFSAGRVYAPVIAVKIK